MAVVHLLLGGSEFFRSAVNINNTSFIFMPRQQVAQPIMLRVFFILSLSAHICVVHCCVINLFFSILYFFYNQLIVFCFFIPFIFLICQHLYTHEFYFQHSPQRAIFFVYIRGFKIVFIFIHCISIFYVYAFHSFNYIRYFLNCYFNLMYCNICATIYFSHIFSLINGVEGAYRQPKLLSLFLLTLLLSATFCQSLCLVTLFVSTFCHTLLIVL